MKKRSKWLGAFALVCASVVCFAFFGCGDSQNGGVTGGGKVDGDTDPKDIVSQQMDETQWKAAFADTNFVNVSAKGKMTESLGEESGTSVNESKIDGDKTYSKSTSGESVDESYSCVENGKTYRYYYDDTDQKWTRSETSYSGGSEAATYLIFKDDFAKFTYDAETKAYKAATYSMTIGDRTQSLQNVVLKFVDGKVSYMEFSMDVDYGEDEMGSGKIEMTFYDYGTTTVTLPEVSAA